MSTERPGRIPPSEDRNVQDTKLQREAAQRVEKVREVDPDEEARRKRKFQMMMGDEDQLSEVDKNTRAPSPFQTEFYKTDETEEEKPSTEEVSSSGAASYSVTAPETSIEDDIGDAIVPSPSYSSPPNLTIPLNLDEDEEQPPGNLPDSENFWADADFPPNTPLPSPQFMETDRSASRTSGLVPGAKPGAKVEKIKKPGETIPGKEMKPGKGFEAPSLGLPGKPKETKKTEPSPFGVPGKGMEKPKEGKPSAAPKKEESSPFFTPPKPEKGKETASKPTKGTSKVPGAPYTAEKEKFGAPLKPEEKKGKVPEEEGMPTARYLTPEEERVQKKEQIVPFSATKKREEALAKKEKELEEAPYAAAQREEREGRGGGKEKKPVVEKIDTALLPPMPKEFQPPALAATTQAQPYISPQTVPLFFQMVGTMYMMIAPPGISRTEIVLNNPAFANSRFFGATITIEKYATAPDSFNIRLSGSETAVTTFRDNIPNLMTAFQNGNFNFRVNRIDAEYSIERPVYRRKDKREGKESSGGGDFEDRRK